MDFEIVFFAVAMFLDWCFLLVCNRRLSLLFYENQMSFVRKFSVLNPRETILAVGAGSVVFGILLFLSQTLK